MKSKAKTKSVQMSHWLREAIEKKDSNKSRFLREACEEFMFFDKKFTNICDSKIISVNLGDHIINYIKRQVESRRYVSGSEFIRIAAIKHLKYYRKKPKIVRIPKDCVAVPIGEGELKVYNIVRRLELE